MSALSVPWSRRDRLRIGRTEYGGRVVAAVALLLLGLTLAWVPLPTALLLVVAAPIAVGVLLRPMLGIWLLALFAPFSQIRQVSVVGAQVGVAEALLVLTVTSWLLRGAARREFRLPRAPLAIPFLAYIGVQLLSLPGSLSLREALPEMLKWLEMLLIILVMADQARQRDVRAIVCAVLLAGSLQSLLGAYQFFRQVGPEPFILQGRFMRAYGTFAQPNPYGGYLGLVAPLGVSLAIWAVGSTWAAARRGPQQWSRSTTWRLLGAAALAGTSLLLIAAVGMSWSRGAWLGLGAALAVVWGLRSGRSVWLSMLLVVLVAALALLGALGSAPAALTERLADLGDYITYATHPDITHIEITDANFAVIERVAHWRAALGMWSDHPWLGVGMGNFTAVYPSHALPRWGDPLGHAHNIYLHALAETGLVGLAAYVILWAAAFGLAWRLRSATRGARRAVAIGVLGVLVHLAIHNLVDNLFVQSIYLHLAILVGLLPALRAKTALGAP